MQTQDNMLMCYRRGTEELGEKPLRRPPSKKRSTRVFSQKHSLSFVGNVGIYSVGTESVYQIVQFGRIECLASVS